MIITVLPLIVGGLVLGGLAIGFSGGFTSIAKAIENYSRADIDIKQEEHQLAVDKRGALWNGYAWIFGETAYQETITPDLAKPAKPQTGEQRQTAQQNRYNRYSRRSPQLLRSVRNG